MIGAKRGIWGDVVAVNFAFLLYTFVFTPQVDGLRGEVCVYLRHWVAFCVVSQQKTGKRGKRKGGKWDEEPLCSLATSKKKKKNNFDVNKIPKGTVPTQEIVGGKERGGEGPEHTKVVLHFGGTSLFIFVPLAEEERNPPPNTI